MVICHRPFGVNSGIQFDLEIHSRDWQNYKTLGATCGPCGDEDD